jgi:hypothetical protein
MPIYLSISKMQFITFYLMEFYTYSRVHKNFYFFRPRRTHHHHDYDYVIGNRISSPGDGSVNFNYTYYIYTAYYNYFNFMIFGISMKYEIRFIIIQKL